MLQNNLDIQVLKMEMSQYPASISALLILCLVSFSVEAYEVSVWFQPVHTRWIGLDSYTYQSTTCVCSLHIVPEEISSFEVCAEIGIVNGTSHTVRDYNVTISTDSASGIRAANESEYFLAPTVVTFPAGSAQGARQCVNVTIIDDDIIEDDETFFVVFENSSDPDVNIHHLLSRSEVRIEDRDVITLELVNSTIVNVSEGIGSIQLCMNVTNGTVEGSINSQIPGVHYYTSSGTATRSSSYRDFRSTSGFPFFTRGTIPGTTRCIRVTIYDDNLVENDYEYFTFRVQNYRRAVVTQGVTTVNIIDNDVAIVGMENRSMIFNESYITFNLCSRIFNLVVLDIPITVSMAPIPITATEYSNYRDYQPFGTRINGSFLLTFPVGSQSSSRDNQCVRVDIFDDEILEYDEQFKVDLTAVSDPNKLGIDQNRNATIVTILNEDTITVDFDRRRPYSTSETSDLLPICARILVGSLERNVTLTLQSMDGSAHAPGDYSSLDTQITFISGQSESSQPVSCAQLDVVDDNVIEVDREYLTLNMSADEPAITRPATISPATVEIIENDNDGTSAVDIIPGSIVLSSTMYDAYESDGQVRVCAVVQEVTLETNITVELSSQDGTATNEDYTQFTRLSLTFMESAYPGYQLCHTVSITDDLYLESNETFVVLLTSNEPIGTNNMTQALVTIRQDPADFVEFGFQEESYPISEQALLRQNVMVCVVIKSGMLRRNVFVDLVVQDINTQGGVDYTGPSPATLTFTSGQEVGGQQCATFTAVDDELFEDEETVLVSLSSAAGDINGTVRFTPGNDTTTLTILQDPNDLARVELLNATGSGIEGETIEVCCELVSNGGGINRPLSLTMLIRNGTANSGVDFNDSTSYAVAFPPNSSVGTVQCIEISLFNDVLFELEENFIVELMTHDPALTINEETNVGILSIVDIPHPDVVAVSFTSLQYSGTEGVNTAVEVCVEIIAGTISVSASVFVHVLSSSTATAVDFELLGRSLTFTSEDTVGRSQCFTFVLRNDDSVEDTEVISISLTSNDSLVQVAGITKANVTIYEDPNDVATIGLLQPNVTLMENETFSVCVELTSQGTLERNIIVGLLVSNSSAVHGVDYFGPMPSVLTFTHTDSIQCANITIIDNFIFQEEREFVVTLVSDGNGLRVNANESAIHVTVVTDLTDAITVGLSSLQYNVSEAPNAVVTVCATIETGTLGTDVSVILHTPISGSLITATPDVDFVPIHELLNFTEGQSRGNSSCADVVIIPDVYVEEVEFFEVMLLPNPEDRQATIIMADSDRALVAISDGENYRAVTVQPSELNVTTIESGGSGDTEKVVCIELATGNLQRNVTVNVRTVMSLSSTATEGLDYTSLNENVTFISGQNATGDNQRCVSITIHDDYIYEANETFNVVITALDDIVTIADRIIVVTIEEDSSDYVEVSLQPVNTSVSESVSFPVCVEITNGTLGRNISIPLIVESASATDFFGLVPSALTFFSGQSVRDTQCANVTIRDDSIPQGARNLSIRIDNISDMDSGLRVNQILPRIEVRVPPDTDDFIVVGLSQPLYQVTEGHAVNVCVVIEVAPAPVSRDTIVFIVTPNNSDSNTATPGMDFVPVYDEVTFTVGSTQDNSVCTEIHMVPDEFVESREVFEVQLLPNHNDPLGAIVQSDRMRALVAISDVETERQLQLSPLRTVVTVTEGNEAEVCIGVSFGLLQRKIVINVRTISGGTTSATPEVDFAEVVTTLDVSSNEPVCTNITILSDDEMEDCEAFFVGFEIASNFSEVAFIPRDNDRAVVIIMDDSRMYGPQYGTGVTLNFRQSSVNITERDANATEVCVQSSGDSGHGSVTVYLEVDQWKSNAIPGEDYHDIGRLELVFNSDITLICTPVYIIDDQVLESTESIVFTLIPALEDDAAARAINIPVRQATVNILEDEVDGVSVGFTETNYTVQEDEGHVEVCAELLSGTLGTDISLMVESVLLESLQESNSSAMKDMDYTGLPSFILFKTGDIQSCVNVTIVNDGFEEEKEYFNVSLVSDFPGVKLRTARSTIEIVDTTKPSGGGKHVEPCVMKNNETIWMIVALLSLCIFPVLIMCIGIILCCAVRRRRKNESHVEKDESSLKASNVSVLANFKIKDDPEGNFALYGTDEILY